MGLAASMSLVVAVSVVLKARKLSSAVLHTILMAAFMSMAGFTRVDEVYLAIYRISQINNLAWFFSYLAAVAGIYFGARGLEIAVLGVKTHRYTFATIVTLLLLLLIFPWIATEPNRLDHSVPPTWANLSFQIVLYAYCATTLLIIARTYYRHGDILCARLRWLVVAIAASLALTFFGGRLIRLPLLFFLPGIVDWTLFRLYEELLIVAFIASMCFWMAFFLPASAYERIALLVETARKALLLRNLLTLQGEVQRVCPPVVPVPALGNGKYSNYRNLDLSLYQSLIAILDGKKLLAEMIVARQAGENRARTDLLYSQLEAVPDDGETEALYKAYSVIGRRYRQRG
jgi:hypothetical protein